MSMVLDFNEIRKEDIGVAGGKGANLGELTAAGLNVPDGFVLTAEVYKLFLRENGLEQTLREQLAEAGDDEDKLMRIAKALQTAIQHGRFPKEIEALIREKYSQLGDKLSVAVRSSATAEDLPDASFAGQQESYLNIVGVAAVLNSVRRCYASLWGRRAVCYRVYQGYAQTSVSIAVVVQEMVESEKSGVLFTVNPLSKKENEMQINASYGLGESVVSGSVSADSYIVDKSGEILEITIGSKATQIVYADKAKSSMYADKPASDLCIEEADTAEAAAGEAAQADTAVGEAAKANATVELAVSETLRKVRALDDGEIQALVQAGLAIERHYGLPMDIEWAMKKDKLYILQARAITTLGPTEDTDRLVRAYTSKVRLNGSIRANMSFFLKKFPLPTGCWTLIL